MNFRRLIVALIIAGCSVPVFYSPAISGEYKSQNFPNDQVLSSQAWESPDYRPIKILGKQKLSNDEYRLVYLSQGGSVTVMTVIKLDTNLWYHSQVPALREGIFTEPKK